MHSHVEHIESIRCKLTSHSAKQPHRCVLIIIPLRRCLLATTCLVDNLRTYISRTRWRTVEHNLSRSTHTTTNNNDDDDGRHQHKPKECYRQVDKPWPPPGRGLVVATSGIVRHHLNGAAASQSRVLQDCSILWPILTIEA